MSNEEGDMEDGDPGADKHPHRTSNHDGSYKLHGTLKNEYRVWRIIVKPYIITYYSSLKTKRPPVSKNTLLPIRFIERGSESST